MTSNKPEKASYEELQSYALECENKLKVLSEKYNSLTREYINLQQSQIFLRLEFLFKVVATPSMFPQSFLDKCVEEIQELLIIPEKTQEDDSPLDATQN